MSKALAYEKITARIIAALEAGTVPWRKPWKAGDQWPRNLKSKKNYRGINVWMLSLSEYSSPWWVTFKQAKSMGGKVRKGEKGTVVVFWKRLKIKDKETEEDKIIPFLRYYYVFNVEQVDGLEEKIPETKVRTPVEAVAAADAIVDGYPAAPAIKNGGVRASYSPLTDAVSMPPRDSFEGSERYYSTLFHELVHSTGHSKRLDRGLDSSFGSSNYSQEELVAEMGAAFLCGESSIETPEQSEQSAAYIANWLERLNSDSRLVVTAAAQAQRGVDHILSRTWDDA